MELAKHVKKESIAGEEAACVKMWSVAITHICREMQAVWCW